MNRSRSPRRRTIVFSNEIAELALEAAEDKLEDYRNDNRRRSSTVTVLPNKGSNPFLSRLGSPYVVSRSILGDTQMDRTNLHPLKARLAQRVSRKSTTTTSLETSTKPSTALRKIVHKLSVLDTPAYIMLVLVLSLLMLPKLLGAIQDRFFEWHELSYRRLEGRSCVMSLFIDKLNDNEFNPDLAFTGNQTLLDTYRTRGQMKIISRLIGSVADSFRNHLHQKQHVVFAGVRDGGHLAQEALLQWPLRGTYPTSLHIISDSGNLDDIEDRFTAYNPHFHLYDQDGNLAGKVSEDDDDALRLRGDELLPDMDETFVPEINLQEGSFQDILWSAEEDDNGTNVIPYFHVDGQSYQSQLELLQKARSLFERNAIAVVGIEHSSDLEMQDLIDFFNPLHYKTFALGLRQLMRIDNLCPEVLDNILDYPGFDDSPWFGYTATVKRTPPFFVAMPKSRHGKEEMTIQHMYDLFSGAGGGGQVKTANDRKVPGADASAAKKK